MDTNTATNNAVNAYNTGSGKMGLLIDYEFCTGCHTCEMACKVEHNLPEGQWGIEIAKIGPREISPNVWDYHYVPLPTGLCDLCADRVKVGRWPTCVHHCQSQIIEYGDVETLSKMIDKQKMVLFVP